MAGVHRANEVAKAPWLELGPCPSCRRIDRREPHVVGDDDARPLAQYVQRQRVVEGVAEPVDRLVVAAPEPLDSLQAVEGHGFEPARKLCSAVVDQQVDVAPVRKRFQHLRVVSPSAPGRGAERRRGFAADGGRAGGGVTARMRPPVSSAILRHVNLSRIPGFAVARAAQSVSARPRAVLDRRGICGVEERLLLVDELDREEFRPTIAGAPQASASTTGRPNPS